MPIEVLLLATERSLAEQLQHVQVTTFNVQTWQRQETIELPGRVASLSFRSGTCITAMSPHISPPPAPFQSLQERGFGRGRTDEESEVRVPISRYTELGLHVLHMTFWVTLCCSMLAGPIQKLGRAQPGIMHMTQSTRS